MKERVLWDISDRGMDITMWCGVPCILQFFVTLPLGMFVHEVFMTVGLFAVVVGIVTFFAGMVIHVLFKWLAMRKARKSM